MTKQIEKKEPKKKNTSFTNADETYIPPHRKPLKQN